MLLPALIPGPSHPRATPRADRAVLLIVDVRGCATARAARSLLTQRVTQLQCDLFTHPQLERAAILVLAGDGRAARSIRRHSETLASAVLRRVELRRGRACGILVVIDDQHVPDDGVQGRVQAALHQIPEGCDVVDAADVVALGLRPAVFNARA